MSVAPCEYPNCRDADGNPALTERQLCDHHEHQLRRLLDWVVGDYVYLRANLPMPPPSGNTRVTTSREYGHPAEWASDMCASIAGVFDSASEAVRDHLHLLPPPPYVGHDEARTVAHAWRTLTGNFNTLVDYPGTEAAAGELHALHNTVRRKLGHGHRRQKVYSPCPDCSLVTLVREVGLDRSDQITCLNCGRTIPAEHYQLYARILLSELEQPQPRVELIS